MRKFLDEKEAPILESLTWKNSTQYTTADQKSKKRSGESQQDCISRKIKKNMDEGMPHKQAIAVAHSQCGASKKK